ncbi:MAG TPA: ferritin family protein [Dehalococcoidia bacterium]|nr:ferritin family protein [Dehalococcoidia bacterium]
MNELDALSLAVKREKEAHQYYSEAAARSTSETGRKMFSWLASEEEGHLKILEKQWEEIKGSGKWLSEAGWCTYGNISNPVECTEFPEASEAKGEPKPDAPELEILKKAIEDEREASAYYADLAKSTTDPNGKAMLEKLSKVEQGHLDLLEEEHQWLSKSKDMFTIHRFTLPPR